MGHPKGSSCDLAEPAKATQAALAKQTSTHVTLTAHSGTTGATEKIIADVGSTSGTEDISEGSAGVTITVTPSFAYVSGNKSGLTKLFGLSASQAAKVGRKWVSWTAGTGQYRTFIRTSPCHGSPRCCPRPKGQLRRRRRLGAEERTYVLKCKAEATTSMPPLSNTMAISSSEPILPLADTATASGGTKITTVLSKWGEEVVVPTSRANSTISSTKLGS